MGKDFSGGEFTYIFSAGINSLFNFSWKGYQPLLGDRLLYAGHYAPGAKLSDSFNAFETDLDATLPFVSPSVAERLASDSIS